MKWLTCTCYKVGRYFNICANLLILQFAILISQTIFPYSNITCATLLQSISVGTYMVLQDCMVYNAETVIGGQFSENIVQYMYSCNNRGAVF